MTGRGHRLPTGADSQRGAGDDWCLVATSGVLLTDVRNLGQWHTLGRQLANLLFKGDSDLIKVKKALPTCVESPWPTNIKGSFTFWLYSYLCVCLKGGWVCVRVSHREHVSRWKIWAPCIPVFDRAAEQFLPAIESDMWSFQWFIIFKARKIYNFLSLVNN